ncbi:MAG: choice-of-anchor V domain-containing protein [Flavobacteriales bacterium]
MNLLKAARWMKNHPFIPVFLVLGVLFVALSSNSNGRATAGNRGNTGAPGENTCGQCHSGTSFGAVTVSIQIFELGTTTPVNAYTPGAAYDMRVTVSQGLGIPAGYGFQMTALRAANNAPLAGYSNLATNVKQITLNSGPQAGRTYVEHNGVTNNNQFNFRWTAPAANSGTVNFTASGNAVNGNGGSTGDSAGAGSLSLPEAQPLAVSAMATNPDCFGATNGSIFVTVNTGVPPYSFAWSDGSMMQNRTNLAAGSYTLTVTDAVQQSFQQNFTLTQPAAIEPAATTVDATVPGGIGSVALSATSGAGDYTFSIDGVGLVTEFPLSLQAGTYTYTVTDANGCSIDGSFTVGQPAPLTLDASESDISCFGANDGAIVINGIAGATPPYTLQWDVDESLLTALAPGTYSLTVTDAVDYTLTFSFEITEPELLEATGAFAPINCFGENATVVIAASGGTAPYTGTGEVALSAGNYTLDVIDANGCTAQIAVDIVEPEALVVNAATPILPCEGGEGEIVITAEGGALPYDGTGSFPVTTSGAYSFTVTDANGCSTEIEAVVESENGFTASAGIVQQVCHDSCDGSIALTLDNATEPVSYAWSDGSDASMASNLCAGDYTAVITDANGCVFQASYTIDAIAPLSGELTIGSIACFGESTSAEVAVSGGTPGYTVVWTDASGDVDPSTISAGSYSVLITDANGCSLSLDQEITQPDELTFSAVVIEEITDMPGVIAVEVDGGTAPYTFTWSDGSTASTLESIFEGSYSLTVTDANGCTLSGAWELLPIGIAESELVQMRLYPNPFNERFTVHATQTIERIQVFGMDGRMLIDAQHVGVQHTLSVDFLPSGSYVLVATFADGILVKRMMKG